MFQFQRDVYKFVFLLGGISLLGFFGVFPGLLKTIEEKKEIILKLCDSITIAVPPSLPASMGIGMVYTLARLRKQKIYCIQSARIPVAARVQTYVFDKTGTLTEEGLCVMGARVCNRLSSKFE